jgi:hypothetical protein
LFCAALSIAAIIFYGKMMGPWQYTPTAEQFAWMNGWGRVVWKSVLAVSLVGSACGIIGALRREKLAAVWLCLNIIGALISFGAI